MELLGVTIRKPTLEERVKLQVGQEAALAGRRLPITLWDVNRTVVPLSIATNMVGGTGLALVGRLVSDPEMVRMGSEVAMGAMGGLGLWLTANIRIR